MIDTTGKTLQQVSDEIAAKLIEQGERCMRPNLGCAYGDGKGRHCALGWLLPGDNDDLMKTSGSLSYLIRVADRSGKGLGANDAFIRDNAQALRQIQRVHDYGTQHEREQRLKHLENRHAINVDAWRPWVKLGKKQL